MSWPRVFFFKQKTAYELRISDWSSDVCSSDLRAPGRTGAGGNRLHGLVAERPAVLPVRGRRSRPLPDQAGHPDPPCRQIGRASCRERVCQYVYISVIAVSLKKQQLNVIHHITLKPTRSYTYHIHTILPSD